MPWSITISPDRVTPGSGNGTEGGVVFSNEYAVSQNEVFRVGVVLDIYRKDSWVSLQEDWHQLRYGFMDPAPYLAGPSTPIHAIRAKAQIWGYSVDYDVKMMTALGDENVTHTAGDRLEFNDNPPILQVQQYWDFLSPWHYVDWNGDDWTTTSIADDLYAWFKPDGLDDPNVSLGNNQANIGDLFLEISAFPEPWQQLVFPANGQLGVHVNPLIRWTFMGFGDPQYKYRLRIFTPAQVAVGGFNPDSSPGVYDSDWRTSSIQQHQIPTGLLDGGTQYYLYIRTSKNMNIDGVTGRPEYLSSWTIGSFTTNNKPVAFSHGPIPIGVDPSTVTRRPFLDFQYGDAEGNWPDKWEMKVFTDVVHDAGGFDPDTDPVADGSGIQDFVVGGSNPPSGSAPNPPFNTHYYWRTNLVLPNGVYHQYTRIRQGHDGQWSDWDAHEFELDVNLPYPAYPKFTAEAEETEARVKLTVKRETFGIQPDKYTIERQDIDDPLVWHRVRGLETPLAYVGSTMYTHYDYEAPGNTSLTYRAFLYDSTTLDDEPSPPAYQYLTLPIKHVWLKQVLEPSRNVRFPVNETWLTRTSYLDQKTHRPLDRKLPVVVKGLNQGDSFDLTFLIIGQDLYRTLMFHMERDIIFLVQTPKEMWFMKKEKMSIRDHLWDELHNEEPAWYVTVSFIEVDPPEEE